MTLIDTLSIPSELLSVIGTEKVDFSVNPKRKQPRIKSLMGVFGGLVVLVFISFFIPVFLEPWFTSNEPTYDANAMPYDNRTELLPTMIPAFIIGVFILLGLIAFGYGIYSLFQNGGVVVGTNNRLIKFRKGVINTYDWEQFSASMEVNTQKGDLTLQLRTGKVVSKKNRRDEFVPDIVYISGVTEVLEIERICRERIKQHDPTPPLV